MKFSFLNKAYPVIAGIMSGQSTGELIAEARNCESEGAGGIAISLADLAPEFRNANALKTVIESVNLPFMFFCYRDDKYFKNDEDKRQELLLSAADAGASMIDVMGDLYDPSPMEITCNPEAVDKQKRLIEKIHEKGAEVVISSHMQCSRSSDEVLAHLREFEKRGADLVKIVTTVNSADELAEALHTTMILKRELKTPFVHLCNGKFSRPHRFMCPIFGVSVLFGVSRYEPRYGFAQPKIRELKTVLENLHWNIDNLR